MMSEAQKRATAKLREKKIVAQRSNGAISGSEPKTDTTRPSKARRRQRSEV